MTFGFNELPPIPYHFKSVAFLQLVSKFGSEFIICWMVPGKYNQHRYSEADKRYLNIFSSTGSEWSPVAPGGKLVAGTNVGYLLFWPKMFPRPLAGCWFLLSWGRVMSWVDNSNKLPPPSPAASSLKMTQCSVQCTPLHSGHPLTLPHYTLPGAADSYRYYVKTANKIEDKFI